MDKVTLYRGTKNNLPKGASINDVFFTTDTLGNYSGLGPFKGLISYTGVLFVESRAQLPLVGSEHILYVVHNRFQTVMLMWDDMQHMYITDDETLLKGIDASMSLKIDDSNFTIVNMNVHDDLTLTLPTITADWYIFRFLNISDKYYMNIKTDGASSIFIPYAHASDKITTPIVSIKHHGYLALFGNVRGWYVKAGMANIALDKPLWADNYLMQWNRPKHLST